MRLLTTTVFYIGKDHRDADQLLGARFGMLSTGLKASTADKRTLRIALAKHVKTSLTTTQQERYEMGTLALDGIFQAMAERVTRQQDRLDEAQSRIDDAIAILTGSTPGNFRANLVDAGDLIGHVQIEVDLQRQDVDAAVAALRGVLREVSDAHAAAQGMLPPGVRTRTAERSDEGESTLFS